MVSLDHAMRIGLGLLHLAPQHFWSLTPRELAAMLPRTMPSEAPDRETLTRLMAKHPDKPKPGEGT